MLNEKCKIQSHDTYKHCVHANAKEKEEHVEGNGYNDYNNKLLSFAIDGNSTFCEYYLISHKNR